VKVLLLGRDGQVGYELARALPEQTVALDRKQCNLASIDEVTACVRAARPGLIVNAAAYTAVDRAEQEAALAFAVNAAAPAALATEARRLGAFLVHYSTDYVFDGQKRAPYVESDTLNPLQVYGRSKLAGEEAIRGSGCSHLILRSSWVYAGRGKNFVLTMLEKARAGARLRVVADQWGAPTWARDIAQLTAAVLRLREPPQGTFHAAAAGATTWWEFAREIFRLAGLPAEVESVSTAEYANPTPRPAYSVLDSSLLARTTGVPAIGDWRERLSAFNELKVLRDLGGLAEHD
jgi:dTDP-4-dehydrorhamnose reductase